MLTSANKSYATAIVVVMVLRYIQHPVVVHAKRDLAQLDVDYSEGADKSQPSTETNARHTSLVGAEATIAPDTVEHLHGIYWRARVAASSFIDSSIHDFAFGSSGVVTLPPTHDDNDDHDDSAYTLASTPPPVPGKVDPEQKKTKG